MKMRNKSTILAFVADLNSNVRIESAAEKIGFRVHGVENADTFGPPDVERIGRQFAEPLEGRKYYLIETITQIRPRLIIFDLSNQAIPWEEWIQVITSVPATRRFPVLCFGSHVDLETLKRARKAGATRVVPRSKFFGDLPELIQELALVDNIEGIDSGCKEELSTEARKGLEEFNRGEYFQAHESLESAWNADTTPTRELYRAVLQVAVAYYQIVRRNYNGALKMFLRVRQWIEPLPDSCRGINVAQLRADVQNAYNELLSKGPARISEFDRSLLRPIQFEG